MIVSTLIVLEVCDSCNIEDGEVYYARGSMIVSTLIVLEVYDSLNIDGREVYDSLNM